MHGHHGGGYDDEARTYVQRLRRELRRAPLARRRVLREIEHHLSDRATGPIPLRGRRGGDLDQEFGAPRELARELVAGWRRQRRRAVTRVGATAIAVACALGAYPPLLDDQAPPSPDHAVAGGRTQAPARTTVGSEVGRTWFLSHAPPRARTHAH